MDLDKTSSLPSEYGPGVELPDRKGREEQGGAGDLYRGSVSSMVDGQGHEVHVLT